MILKLWLKAGTNSRTRYLPDVDLREVNLYPTDTHLMYVSYLYVIRVGLWKAG